MAQTADSSVGSQPREAMSEYDACLDRAVAHLEQALDDIRRLEHPDKRYASLTSAIESIRKAGAACCNARRNAHDTR